MVWLKFAACVVIILFSGTRLARYGDVLAERTGWGRLWIGLVLIAIITSMPELVTSVSSVTLVKLPDLAVGNVIGSNIFNLTLLVLADVMYRHGPLLSQASSRHVMSAGSSILITAAVGGGILAGERFPGLALGWVSVPSIIILVLYIGSVWWLFRLERSRQPETTSVIYPEYKELPARTLYLRFGLASAVIIGAAIWLAFIGDEIVATYTWSASFVGSLFVAITTSLPELAVTVAAVRLGAIDMAVANILGSNMFDLAIIAPTDFAFRQGPIFSSVSRVHLITVVVAIVMTLVVIAGLRFRQQRKTFFLVSWYSPVLIALYVFGIWGVYHRLFSLAAVWG